MFLASTDSAYSRRAAIPSSETTAAPSTNPFEEEPSQSSIQATPLVVHSPPLSTPRPPADAKSCCSKMYQIALLIFVICAVVIAAMVVFRSFSIISYGVFGGIAFLCLLAMVKSCCQKCSQRCGSQ